MKKEQGMAIVKNIHVSVQILIA